jgi:hypothetical protein
MDIMPIEAPFESIAAELTVMRGPLTASFHGTCIIVSANFVALRISHLCSSLFPGMVGCLLTIYRSFCLY